MMCKWDEAFTMKEMLEETGRCKNCKFDCEYAGKQLSEENMSNEEMLDELVWAYEEMRDYIYRSDFVKWSQEKEEKVTKKYTDLREKILNKMKD